MNKEKMPTPGEKKERIYEERIELGEISVDSGVVNLVDPTYTEDFEKHGLEVSIGNDGRFKVFGVYRVLETPIPKEFAEGKEDAKTYNKQLIRLKFE